MDEGYPETGSKLFRMGVKDERLVYAGCGDIAEMVLIAEWIAGGMEPGERPEIGEASCAGLVLNLSTRQIFSVNGKRPILFPVKEKFTAVGTGRMCALAAMALGRTAVEAVALAMRFDVNTGGEVESVSLT